MAIRGLLIVASTKDVEANLVFPPVRREPLLTRKLKLRDNSELRGESERRGVSLCNGKGPLGVLRTRGVI